METKVGQFGPWTNRTLAEFVICYLLNDLTNGEGPTGLRKHLLIKLRTKVRMTGGQGLNIPEV